MKLHKYENKALFNDGEVDLVQVWYRLVDRRYFILFVTFIVVCIASAKIWSIEDRYRSSILLSPVSSGGGVAEGISGLAGLAGISLGDRAVNEKSKALAVLTSYKFLSNYIAKNKLKPTLFAEYYDPKRKEWVEGEPSIASSVGILSKALSIDDDAKTGLVTISIEWTDAENAAYWANDLIVELNNYIRQLDIVEASDSVVFLQEKLAEMGVVEMQNVLFKLIESQTRKIMLASVRDEYVFSVIDPAIAPDYPVGPLRKLYVLMSIILGLIIGVMLALIRKGS